MAKMTDVVVKITADTTVFDATITSVQWDLLTEKSCSAFLIDIPVTPTVRTLRDIRIEARARIHSWPFATHVDVLSLAMERGKASLMPTPEQWIEWIRDAETEAKRQVLTAADKAKKELEQ
jgi:hypothetical protein